MNKYTVEQVHSVDEFLANWTKAMVDVHWFKEEIPFHYTRDEMVEEIRKEFAEADNLHLVAKSKDDKKVLGVLRVKIQEDSGTLGKWEPVVLLKHRNTEIGKTLVEKAFLLLKEKKVRRAACMLKYPLSKPEVANWHISLYKKCGFKQRGPPGGMLLADLSLVKRAPRIKNICFIDRNEVPLEEFVNFVQMAYMSTAEDRIIHGFDQYVSDREKTMNIHRAIKNGKFGFSPPECWKVALLRDETAGFIIGFMPKSEHRPPHGVIANLGVFPEFRRKGIAYTLINEIHNCFKKYGCEYSIVGTPKTNHPAIKLYQKIGYEPVFELISFEKTFDTK
jgi:ribosomal protein S18 acetylase RimI-like enzyme